MFYTILIIRIVHGVRQAEMVLDHYKKLSSATNAVSLWISDTLAKSPGSRVLNERTEAFVHGKGKAIYGATVGDGTGNGLEAVIVEKHFADEDAPQEQEKPFKACMVFGEHAADYFADKEYLDEETVNKENLPMTLDRARELACECDGSLVVRAFATDAERKAYFQGINDSQGWEDYYSAGNDEVDFADADPDTDN